MCAVGLKNCGPTMAEANTIPKMMKVAKKVHKVTAAAMMEVKYLERHVRQGRGWRGGLIDEKEREDRKRYDVRGGMERGWRGNEEGMGFVEGKGAYRREALMVER